jgi:hypothetical protein
MADGAAPGAKDTQWDLNLISRELVPTYINHFAVYTMSGSMRINMGETLYSPGAPGSYGSPRLSIVVNTDRALELAKVILKSYSTLNPSNGPVSAAVELLGPLIGK